MAFTESVPSLLLRLCDLYHNRWKREDEEERRDIPRTMMTKFDGAVRKKRLKSKTYETIFRYLRIHRKNDALAMGDFCPLGVADEMNVRAFEFRRERKYDGANRLDKLLSKLSRNEDEFDETTKNVLRFLLRLQDTAKPTETNAIGHNDEFQHDACVVQIRHVSSAFETSKRPLVYGETKLDAVPFDGCHYMHYPAEIFQLNGSALAHLGPTKYSQIDEKVFLLKPKSEVHSNEEMSDRNSCKRETKSSSDLFGALVRHSKRETVFDLFLDIPELTNDPVELKIPKLFETSSDDEGFVDTLLSSGVSPSSQSPASPIDSRFPTSAAAAAAAADVSRSFSSSSSLSLDVWKEALDHDLNRHHTWESVGRLSKGIPTRDKPYLTDVGREVLNEVWKFHVSQLRMIDPHLRSPPIHTIDVRHLVNDLINLLVGIPSHNFPLLQSRFSMKEGLCLNGISPEALEQLCQSALRCGTDFHRLSAFARARLPRSTERFGLVVEAFRSGVRKYLRYYEACVLLVSKTKTLLEIVNSLRRVTNQMRFLSELCRCDTDEDENDRFPTGCHLLTYLYNECLALDGSEHYHLMLSLLQTTSVPYLMFIEDWVFHGLCLDEYDEFMLQVKDDYLNYRDRHYWNEGFRLKDEDPSQTLPSFLTDVALDIFTCGKSINLLRLCSQQHFLFGEEQNNSLQVRLTFSETELSYLEKRCQVYLGRMQAMARQCSRTREDVREKAEKAKQDLMVRARRAATEELQRLQDQIFEKRKRQDEKKRKLFAELKEQRENELNRKEMERTKVKEEDKIRMESFPRQQLLEASVDSELENEAREELVEYYAKLNAEAIDREERALWRIRRHKLNVRRLEFFESQENQMNDELKKVKVNSLRDDDPNIFVKLDSTSTENDFSSSIKSDDKLPRWARTSVSEAGRLDDERSDEAPDVKTNVEEEELDEKTKDENVTVEVDLLPSWARKSLRSKEEKDLNAKESSSLNSVEGRDVDGSVKFDVDVDERTTTTTCDEDDVVSRTDGQEKKEISEVEIKLEMEEDEEKPKDKDIEIKKDVDDVVVCSESSTDDATNRVVRKSALDESQQLVPRPHLKMVLLRGVDEESEGDVLSSRRSHVKTNETMNATKESEEEQTTKPHRMNVSGKCVAMESNDDVRNEKRCGVKMNQSRNATKESEAAELRTKRQNVFGHVSQISRMEFDILAPKLKRNVATNATTESSVGWNEFSSFQIQPHRRKVVEGRSIDKETNANDDDADERRSHVKMSKSTNSLTESERFDGDLARTERFKARNVHGHSSDSSVQNILYGERTTDVAAKTSSLAAVQEEIENKNDERSWLDEDDNEVQKYKDDFHCLDEFPMSDLMPWTHLWNSSSSASEDLSYLKPNKFISLPSMIKRSIMAPILAQISLVNQTLVNYFTVDLEIENHFLTLQRFILLQDGEFSQMLCQQLFDKLAVSNQSSDILNPMFLNNALQTAMTSSLNGDSTFSHGISFVVKFFPSVLLKNATDTLDCLELTYKVDWPVNIIITQVCLRKYGQIFNFMLKLRRTVWVLKDIFHRLKRDASLYSLDAVHSVQLRRLQLYRHEMQHFVEVIQEYISSQVIHVSWHEFQHELGSRIKTFDDLIRCHADYLNRCIARCLLNKKASPILKILHDIFGVILTFNNQLVSQSWQKQTAVSSRREDVIVHPAFDHLQETYRAFHQHSKFLFKVVGKIAERGYQPHFQDLLLRLGFNDFYKLETSSFVKNKE